jgi:predicted nucleotidyltransferase
MMTEQHTQLVNVTALTEYLAVQPDLIAVYLFGSRATGRARAESDVDVAVLLDEEDSVVRFERRLRVANEVEDIVGRPVDLIVLNDAPPILQHQVLKHGRLLYERDRRARVAFEVRAGQIYADLKPMYDFHTRDLMRKIKEVGLSGRRRHHRQPTETSR